MLRKNKAVIAVGAIGVALATTSIATGAGEGAPVDGGNRNPSPNETQSYNAETEIIADTATYGTRQSNKSNNGGGAIYGCRSAVGGTPANNEPCIRSNNLAAGLAFEFQSGGATVGTITASTPGAGSKPFTTNATGVATGLNADQVDGKGADDIVKEAVAGNLALTPIAQVAADGKAGTARGVVENGVTKQAGVGDYDVVFNGDLSTCAVSATVVGTDPGIVTATPDVAADKKTTRIDVRTFTPVAAGPVSAGGPIDRAFHLTANC